MKLFHCDHCRHPIFFENIQCLNCQHYLGFLPDLAVIGSLEDLGDGQFKSPISAVKDITYKRCNWLLHSDESDTFCESCRLSEVIPNQEVPGNQEAWYRLEVAKRRVIYSLKRLKLPIVGKKLEPERGLEFRLLADEPGARVFTGHSDGLITLNIAEANDVERERRRVNLHEPYRTLLGHFRHEIGHYYWNVLIENSAWLQDYRALFGDERASYEDAMKSHYQNGAPANWQDSFISAYATMHPWEDWAETWAHYLHMTDTLEMARASGLSLRPTNSLDPSLKSNSDSSDFDQTIKDWLALTFVLNNLNRGLGLSDGYPFILSEQVIAKLRFVDDVISKNSIRTLSGDSDQTLEVAAA
jgi:hypothetical protein